MSQPDPQYPSAPTVVKATLTGAARRRAVPVHFNPASLVYTVEKSRRQQGSDPKRRQFAGQFTGKLTMDLQFDTTDTGDGRAAVLPIQVGLLHAVVGCRRTRAARARAKPTRRRLRC